MEKNEDDAAVSGEERALSSARTREADDDALPAFSPHKESTPSSSNPEDRQEVDAHGGKETDEVVPFHTELAAGGSQTNNRTSETAAANATKESSTATATSSSDLVKRNPLIPEGGVEADDGNRHARVRRGDAWTSECVRTEEVEARPSEGDGAVTANGTPMLPGISAVIQNLPNPSSAEEYCRLLAELDRIRCSLGAELTPIAKEVYGPTTPFNPDLPHSRVLGYVHSEAPNCDHRQPLQIVAGRQFYIPVLLFVLLGIHCAMNTVAYYQLTHWALLLPMWGFYLATVVYGLLCAFTNPGIVPPRHYTGDIKDRGDVIVVRVPAPNAKKVQERQREVAREEALDASGGTGATSLKKRRKNATSSGLERYFESATGKLYPVAPLFSEEERQYKYKDEKDNKGKEDRNEVAVVEFPLTYCWTCGMYKAPRTHHCSKCNVCVDDHDHHCPWTGCCIGRGNYRFFHMCLFCLHMKSIYAVLLSIGVSFTWMVDHPRKDYADFLAEAYYLPPIIYAMIFSFGIFFTPLYLAHIYMSAMGFTTSEMLKRKFESSNYFLGVNPWDAGFFGNFLARLLSRYDKWTDTRYYYAVTVAGVLEDKRVDWLLILSPEERAKVQAMEAKQKQDMESAWQNYNDT